MTLALGDKNNNYLRGCVKTKDLRETLRCWKISSTATPLRNGYNHSTHSVHNKGIFAFDRSILKIRNCPPPTRTAVTIAPSNENGHAARVRRPRLFVSSRMLRYKTKGKRFTFKKPLGQVDPGWKVIIGDARIRRILVAAREEPSTINVPSLVFLRRATKLDSAAQRLFQYRSRK